MFTLSSSTSPWTLAPGVSSCIRFRQRSRVLLPHPDGPMIAVTTWAGNKSETSRTARCWPNSAVRCAAWRRSRVLADATIALPRDPPGGDGNDQHESQEHERGRPRQTMPFLERARRIYVDLQRQGLHRLRDVHGEVQIAHGGEQERGGLAGNSCDAHEAPRDDSAVRQRGYPSASAASRNECGTRRTISSVVRASIGIIIIASATLPASAEYPWVARTMNVHATMPTTIDGVPLSTSAMNRTTKPSRPDPYSARNSPAATPIGTPINAPRPTMMPVPTIALATPPPDSPAATGPSVT